MARGQIAWSRRGRRVLRALWQWLLSDEFEVQALTATLPVPPTPLIGRSRELAAIVRALRRADGPTGHADRSPGGVGKTRLALATAADLAGDVPRRGLPGCLLAGVEDAALFLPEVAGSGPGGARRRRAQPGGVACSPTFGAARAAGARQLGAGAARARRLGVLLAACPALHVLVTSRAPLRLQGRAEFPVRPLALQTPAATRPAELAARAGRRALRRAGAGGRSRLRADRRQRRGRGRDLPPARRAAAGDRAGRRPIEVLPPGRCSRGSIGACASDRRRARTSPARQQTLRAAIAWSHDLLAPEEQVAFPAAGRLRRRLHARGGRGGGRRAGGCVRAGGVARGQEPALRREMFNRRGAGS